MPGPVEERCTDGPDQHRRGHVGTERLVSAAAHQNAQRVCEYDAEVDDGKGRQRERDVPGVIALEAGIGAVNAVGLDAREQHAVRALTGQRGQPGERVATAHAFDPGERVVADAPIWSGVGGRRQRGRLAGSDKGSGRRKKRDFTAAKMNAERSGGGGGGVHGCGRQGEMEL